MRTIGVVTTSRADYGIYVPVLKAINARRGLRFHLYVTGSHLSKAAGMTVRLIERDGFKIAGRVAVKGGDQPSDIAAAMAAIISGFSGIYKKDKPDILLTLGDRFDMHASALAAVPFNIPIAHIHGGELTRGSFDEYFRHSLTKLSHLHFASTKIYARRLMQMGEEPWRIVISGAPALDNILHRPLMTRVQLAKKFGVDFSKPVLLITFHPVTLEYQRTARYIADLLRTLGSFKDYHIVFTAPNTDTYSGVILKAIKQFVAKHANAFYVPNFGAMGYLSMMRYAAAMAGNSSSGIIEAASFQLPVINIGTRQIGRVRTKNVIDAGYRPAEIAQGIRKGLSASFRASLKGLKNPYGDGKAACRIADALARVDMKRLKVKKFRDLKGLWNTD